MASIIETKTGKFKAIVRRAALGAPLRTKTFTHRKDASAWARKIEAEVEQGVWRPSSKAERTRLREALTKYEEEVTPLKKSARGEKSILNIIRADAGALLDKPLSRINGGDIAHLRDKWRGDGMKANTIRRRLALLSNLYTVAGREWRMPGLGNPVLDAMPRQENDARSRRVTAAELKAIIDATGSVELPAFARLLCESAMRRSELHRLRWSNISLRDRTAFLPDTKNEDSRTVPLSRRAATILERIPRRRLEDDRPDDRVFSITADAFSKAFRKARKRARARYEADCEKKGEDADPKFLNDLRMHDERHEATSRLASTFSNVLDLSAITGHKDLRMLKRYYHPDPKALAKRMK